MKTEYFENMRVNADSSYDYYKTTCRCGDHEHEVGLWIDYDKNSPSFDFSMFLVMKYLNSEVYDYAESNIYNSEIYQN